MELYPLGETILLLKDIAKVTNEAQDRLKTGLRFVHLFDAKGLQTDGVLLVDMNFKWQLRGETGTQQTLPLR
jgi:hypothetical protein